uniref:Uncharacterized protein n=1 Tax=Beta vulgaris TaxID=161934 RepID=K4Q1W7_BETVU|nr:hypothetical protein [Beta vulgaris]
MSVHRSSRFRTGLRLVNAPKIGERGCGKCSLSKRDELSHFIRLLIRYQKSNPISPKLDRKIFGPNFFQMSVHYSNRFRPAPRAPKIGEQTRLKRPSLCGFDPTYPTTLLEGFAGIIFDGLSRKTFTLLVVTKLINQAIGNALSGLLLVDAILHKR